MNIGWSDYNLLLGSRFQLHTSDAFLEAGVARRQDVLPWCMVSFPEHFQHTATILWYTQKGVKRADFPGYPTGATQPCLSPKHSHREATAHTQVIFYLCSHLCFLNCSLSLLPSDYSPYSSGVCCLPSHSHPCLIPETAFLSCCSDPHVLLFIPARLGP